MKNSTFRKALALLLAFAVVSAASAASPPARLNYQGVLRDASGAPVTGTFDMNYRFYDAETGGNELLVDDHRGAFLGEVIVTNGLFNATLGGGAVYDGSGPGLYTSLTDVFREHSEVWMSVKVGVETLSPRVRIVAAAYALNAASLDGKSSSQFLDTTGAAQSKAGPLTVDTGVAAGSTAITGLGEVRGGFFQSAGGTGTCSAGYGETGVFATSGSGWGAAGRFETPSGGPVPRSIAEVASGDVGIRARGSYQGGEFQDSDLTSTVYLAQGDYGILATGYRAGYFMGDGFGIESYGDVGGYFEDTDAEGACYLAFGDNGVLSYGAYPGAAGWFEGSDPFGGTSQALAAYGGTGLRAAGTSYGGEFFDTNSSGYAQVGADTYKIQGTGAVSFVQNHPREPDQVIVYAAPEGPEAATYTRGSGRLEGGFARLALDPTFALVTNPDIGLTAVATPRSEPVPLAIESLTTGELVVRGPAGSEAGFDYLVHGLRIGFEELAIVQERTRQAPIPSMASHRERFARRPELRSFTALERFRLTEAARGATADGLRAFAAADALRAAIHEFDPAVDTVPGLPMPPEAARPGRDRLVAPSAERGAGRSADSRAAAPAPGPVPVLVERAAVVPEHPATNLFPVAESVEPGDLLVLDQLVPGLLRRAETALDPLVVGVASGPSEERGGRLVVPLAETSFASVKVDASLGAIAPGDLLVSSATRGHAMRATDAPQGTVFAKALEPLEFGTGIVRVLVLNR